MKKRLPTPQKLPSGAWRCQVMVDGKRISVVEETPGAAQVKAVAMREGLIEKKSGQTSLTVGAAIDRYIESKDSILSPSTIRGYKQIRENALQEIMGTKIEKLTQEDVQRAVNRMAKSKSPKYVRNAHGLLSAALGEYRPDFVLRTTMPQKVKTEIQIPTMKEIELLAEKSKGTPFELPFLLAVWMGLRTSEIRGLTWDCIEGDTLHIKQALVISGEGDVLKATKTYSGDRKIRIPPYIMDLINRADKKKKYIVNCNRNALYAQLQKVCRQCNLPHYRFHDLRHVQASVMLALGVPDKYAMERMGHATTNMLKTVYQHTMKSKSEEVADTVDRYFSEKLHTVLHTKN